MPALRALIFLRSQADQATALAIVTSALPILWAFQVRHAAIEHLAIRGADLLQ